LETYRICIIRARYSRPGFRGAFESSDRIRTAEERGEALAADSIRRFKQYGYGRSGVSRRDFSKIDYPLHNDAGSNLAEKRQEPTRDDIRDPFRFSLPQNARAISAIAARGDSTAIRPSLAEFSRGASRESTARALSAPLLLFLCPPYPIHKTERYRKRSGREEFQLDGGFTC